MAVRGVASKLATFRFVGILCLAPGARTCIAHTLPSAPDFFHFRELVGGTAGASLGQWMVESWDATSLVIVNSIAQGVRGYLDAGVIYSSSL